MLYVSNAHNLEISNKNQNISQSLIHSLWSLIHIRYYSREDAEDTVKYISGTILDDRPIRVDFDWGFQEGRQWGRGRSGGQVRHL